LGIFSDISGRIREYMRQDKEALALRLARSMTSNANPHSGFDLVQSYGYDALSNYLRMEQDLLNRYVEYEEMDEYAELSCITAKSHVLLALNPEILQTSKTEFDDASTTCSNILETGGSNKGCADLSSRAIGDLAEDYESGKLSKLLVYAYDHETGKVVVAEGKGPVKTGEAQPVYKVTYETYRRKHQWSVEVTGNHLFMLRDGSYMAAMDLEKGVRLMPCTFKTNVNGYRTVYEPTQRTRKGHSVYASVHQLVGAAIAGRPLREDEVVHHRNRDKNDPRPSNLEVMNQKEHLREHANDTRDEAKRVANISASLVRKWADGAFKNQVSKTHQSDDPEWLKNEKAGKHKRRKTLGKLTEAHRKAIAKGRTLPLAKDVVFAAVTASASFNDASKKLGVSWNTLMRRIEQFGLDRSLLGSNLNGPQPGSGGYTNHKVVSVEYIGQQDVYDIEVPKYHNFAVGDPSGDGFIFVHNSAIDIFADDATQPNTELNRSIWVAAKHKPLETMLDDLLHRQLRLDEEVHEICRTTIKYGNNFEEILVNDDGVVGLNHMPAPTVRRIEGPRGELYGYVQDFKGRFGYSPAEFQQILATRMSMISGAVPGNPNAASSSRVVALEDWEVAHFRLKSKHRRSVYGHSVLEAARWVWKRLMLLEDAALIYRLQRAPERFAYYIDTGDLPPAEALAFVNRVRQQHKKKKFLNPSSGKMDLKYNSIGQDEDFYIPIRKDQQGTRIEVVGSPSWQHMEDIEYFRDKMFAAIKIPKAYLAQDKAIPRAVLSSEDVRFARSVLRIQTAIRHGVSKICRVHLSALDVDPQEAEFDIRMTVPSAIFELAQLEVRNARADLAGRMNEFVSHYWLLSNVFGMSDDAIKQIVKDRDQDKKREAEWQANMMSQTTSAQTEAQMRIQQQYTPQDPMAAASGQAQNQPIQAAYYPGNKPLLQSAEGKALLQRSTLSLTERELLAGDREAEKRAEGKLNHLLKNDMDLANRMQEVGGLLRDLTNSTRQIARDTQEAKGRGYR
jgi:hypothetical protein